MSQPGGAAEGPATPQGGWVPQVGSPSWAGGSVPPPRPNRHRRRLPWPLLVGVIVALSVGAFVAVRDPKGGGRAPLADASAARERLVDGGAACRPLQVVPDDAFGGKVDAPDQMVECTLEREPVRILAWGTTERRKQAMAGMAEVVCKLDDDADPAIVTGPLMIQTYGGDPTYEPERTALDHASALLDAAVTDDLCADG